jgi:hypothetical protein
MAAVGELVCRSGPWMVQPPETCPRAHVGVDDDERQAQQAEGLDPDDPAVIAGIDLVRWELSLGI